MTRANEFIQTSNGKNERALLAKRDFMIFAALIALSIIIYVLFVLPAMGTEGAYARISEGRNIIKKVDLSEEMEFSLEGFPNVVFIIRDNAIAFAEADCPDRICIESGFLRYSGQIAACVPNRIALVVVGRQTENGADTVAH